MDLVSQTGIFAFITLVIAASIIEELIFRTKLYTPFRETVNLWALKKTQ